MKKFYSAVLLLLALVISMSCLSISALALGEDSPIDTPEIEIPWSPDEGDGTGGGASGGSQNGGATGDGLSDGWVVAIVLGSVALVLGGGIGGYVFYYYKTAPKGKRQSNKKKR